MRDKVHFVFEFLKQVKRSECVACLRTRLPDGHVQPKGVFLSVLKSHLQGQLLGKQTMCLSLHRTQDSAASNDAALALLKTVRQQFFSFPTTYRL